MVSRIALTQASTDLFLPVMIVALALYGFVIALPGRATVRDAPSPHGRWIDNLEGGGN